MRLKFVSMVCCAAAMFMSTSCVNDNDNSSKTMTPDEVNYCFRTVRGDYTGDLIYVAQNVKDVNDKTDTLKISWSISNDSTLKIHNFPAKLLADNISDEKLKAALAEADDQDIVCRIGFVNTQPVQFLINPVAPSFTINFEGADHKIQPAFYVNTANSFGSYTSTKSELYMQIIEGAIFMDGKQTTYLSQANPFAFEGKTSSSTISEQ